jgi:5-enolpyruvylshikimate-3-phosphate synthase
MVTATNLTLSSLNSELSAHSTTTVQPITSVVLSKPTLSEQIETTVTSVLTALDFMQHQFDVMLSATPLHPYEKYKAQYLEPNQSCQMLHEIEVPEDFSVDTATCCITSISEKIQENALTQLQMLTSESYQENQSENELCNAFSELSGNTFVVNKEKMSNHLQFLEMTRNITIEQIEKDPVEVARKVLAQYVKLYQ